jgi:inward rectifier potassium channel
MFSDIAVIAERDGVKSLMMRLANQRNNRIVEVQLHAVMALDDTTLEGERIRRFYTLPLARDRVSTFALTWTAMHPITEASPLYKLTPHDLEARSAEILVSLTGMDETFAQTVHARSSYTAYDIVYGRRFADLLVQMPDGSRAVDYTKFHDTIPLHLEEETP